MYKSWVRSSLREQLGEEQTSVAARKEAAKRISCLGAAWKGTAMYWL
jgi:hypothetical protein